MLAKPLMLKYILAEASQCVDTLDAGKGPCAKCVKEGNVDVDAEEISEAPRAEVLGEASCSRRRYR